jgi:hypothetical protein
MIGPFTAIFTLLQMWEPFVLLRKEEKDGTKLPRYREGFISRHFDKISFLVELQALDYQFHTLRQHLLTHVPHNRLTSANLASVTHLVAMQEVLNMQALELRPAIRRTIARRQRGSQGVRPMAV